MGTAPMPSETVEVIKIRTDDMKVVPGGYRPAGGTVYACFWVDIDMPEKHHIIGWEGAVSNRVHHQQVSLAPSRSISRNKVDCAVHGRLHLDRRSPRRDA
jgi:hypothetical protein